MLLAQFFGQMFNCCYPLKSEPIYHKINILIQIKGIEGIPVIIRFKTIGDIKMRLKLFFCIEGIPVIIRFKTSMKNLFNDSIFHVY